MLKKSRSSQQKDSLVEQQELSLNSKQIDKTLIHNGSMVFLQSITGIMLTLTDTAIVGNLLGVKSLAALTIGSAIFNALLGVFIFMIYVTNASVANKFGSGNKEAAYENAIDSIYLALLIGVILIIIIGVFSKQIIHLFNPDPEVFTLACHYLYGLLPSFIGFMLLMASTGVLRGMQNYKLPTIIGVLCVLINVPLNLFLILGLKMDVFGSGMASSVSFCICGIVCTKPVITKIRKAKVSLKPYLKGVASMFVDGFPVFIRSCALWFSITILVFFVSKFGVNGTAAMQVVDAIWGFYFLSIDTIPTSLNSMLSNAIGEKNKVLAKFIVKRARILQLKISIIVVVIMPFSCFWVVKLFSNDATVQSYAAWALVADGITMLIAQFAFLMDGVQIATKDTKFLAYSTMVSMGFFLLVINFVHGYLPHNALGFVLLYAICYDLGFLGARALFGLYRYSKDRYLKHAFDNLR